jgi:hypothetical protein
MQRMVYHVVPNGTEGWQVKAAGGERATSNHTTKDEAIAAAKKLLENDQLGQIKVHKQDGTIELEWTYGADPKTTVG